MEMDADKGEIIKNLNLDSEEAIVEWVREYPETLKLFQEIGLDYTCGGKSLGYAIREKNLKEDEVMKLLAECIREEEQGQDY